MKTVTILGTPVARLTMEETLSTLEGYIEEKIPRQVVTANAEILYRAHTEPAAARLVAEADLVTADGIGVVYASRILGTPVPEKVAGVVLAEKLVALSGSKGWNIFLLGGAPGVAELAKKNLLKSYPDARITGTRDGFFTSTETGALVEEIRAASPHILLVALGFPKQEQFITDNKDILQIPVSIGVGGSLDIFSGTKKRAPRLVQKLGIEFLYRLLQEPSRWRRYLSLPRFILAFFAHDVLKKGKSG